MGRRGSVWDQHDCIIDVLHAVFANLLRFGTIASLICLHNVFSELVAQRVHHSVVDRFGCIVALLAYIVLFVALMPRLWIAFDVRRGLCWSGWVVRLFVGPGVRGRARSGWWSDAVGHPLVPAFKPHVVVAKGFVCSCGVVGFDCDCSVLVVVGSLRARDKARGIDNAKRGRRTLMVAVPGCIGDTMATRFSTLGC